MGAALRRLAAEQQHVRIVEGDRGVMPTRDVERCRFAPEIEVRVVDPRRVAGDDQHTIPRKPRDGGPLERLPKRRDGSAASGDERIESLPILEVRRVGDRAVEASEEKDAAVGQRRGRGARTRARKLRTDRQPAAARVEDLDGARRLEVRIDSAKHGEVPFAQDRGRLDHRQGHRAGFGTPGRRDRRKRGRRSCLGGRLRCRGGSARGIERFGEPLRHRGGRARDRNRQRGRGSAEASNGRSRSHERGTNPFRGAGRDGVRLPSTRPVSDHQVVWLRRKRFGDFASADPQWRYSRLRRRRKSPPRLMAGSGSAETDAGADVRTDANVVGVRHGRRDR